MEESLQKIAETLYRPDWLGIFTTIGTVAAAVISYFSARAAKKAAQSSQESIVLQQQQLEQQKRLDLLKERRDLLIFCEFLMEQYGEAKRFLPKKRSTELEDILSPEVLLAIAILSPNNALEVGCNDDLVHRPGAFFEIKRKAKEIEYVFENKKKETVSDFLELYVKFISQIATHKKALDNSYSEVSQEGINSVTKTYNDTVDVVLKLEEVLSKIKEEKILEYMKKETELSAKDVMSVGRNMSARSER